MHIGKIIFALLCAYAIYIKYRHILFKRHI